MCVCVVQSVDNELKIIRKSSYTALRLYNEIPSQIDQETRVLFVGPIPIEWLLANKRTWGSWGRMRRMFPKVYSRLWSDGPRGENDLAPSSPPMVPVETGASGLGMPVIAGPEGVFRTVNDLMIAPVGDEESLSGFGPGIDGQDGRSDNESADNYSYDEDDLYPHPSRPDELFLSRYLTTEEATSTLHALPVESHEDDVSSSESPPLVLLAPAKQKVPQPPSRSISPSTSIYTNSGQGIISDGDSRISPSPRSTSHLLGNDSHSEFDLSSLNSPVSKKSEPTPIYGPSGSSSRTPFFNGLDASVSTMASMQSYFTARESMGSIDSRADVSVSDEASVSDDEHNNHEGSLQSNDESSESTIKIKKSPPLLIPSPPPPSPPPTQSHRRTSTLDTIKPSTISPDARSYLSGILERDIDIRQNMPFNPPASVARIGTDVTTASNRSRLTSTILKAKSKPAKAGRKVKREYRKRRKSFVVSTEKILKKKKNGEVVMIEKILVMVKAAPKDKMIPPNFNEMEQVDTRLVQRWKEYVVVARKSGLPDAPIYLQFYKSRHIAKVEDSSGIQVRHTGARRNTPELSVAIGRDFEINLYSSLDKSIVLWNKTVGGSESTSKKDNLIYILRPRSEISSMNWLSFLAGIVGIDAQSIITVQVPDLGVSVEIEIPFENFSMIRQFEEQSNLLSLKQITKHSSAPSWLGSFIVEKCLDAMYEVEAIRKQLDENWRGIVKAGLAWRKYDRLEWMFDIHGSQIRSSWAMIKTHHELELRPKVPFSLPVMIKGSDIPLAEPFPIEGFVSRLNSWKGEVRKQKLLNRSYFHTHDNLLFYSLPIRALPPYVGGTFNHNSISAIMAGIPLVCEIAPYRTDDDGNIEWLKQVTTVEEFDEFDLMAQFEMKRRIASISRADGFIDLIELSEIKADFNNRFQLIFKTGTVLHFQVHDEQTRNLWVNQLTNLMIYWKHRRREDMNRTNAVRQQNLEILHIDEDAEAFVGEAASKWETDRGVADPLTYNIAGISCSRSLYMKGLLFQKPSKYSIFRKYYVVLTLTDLILYIPSPSSENECTGGVSEFRVNNYRVQSVALSECYVYSGPLTGSDLLDRDKTFDKDNPGRHALPRAYSDGWKSAEEESLRCFVLWFGKKSYAASKRKDKRVSIRTVNKLGTGGTTMVFMARSRHDRDLWVTALNTVMSRLAVDSHEDIILM